jgi:MoxR-like ATPase
MNHSEYSQKIREALQQQPATLPSIVVDDARRNNAGRCMAALACNRLGQNGESPEHVRHSTFDWQTGTFTLRNSRIADHYWSNSPITVADRLHELASDHAVAYVLIHWIVDDGRLHAWVVPEDVAFAAFAELPINANHPNKTVELFSNDHRLKNAPSAPSFEPFYVSSPLTDGEIQKLQEAIKTDDLIKQERLAAEAGDVATGEDVSEDDGDESAEVGPGYTDETVAFLLELPAHTEDGEWHEQNKKRYQSVLRDPSQNVVEELRAKHIQPLSPVVAGGKRHLSILKKNDYGKGGYHDHYWFAFYDPKAGSKTKSVQLFVRFLGGERVWRYGFAMGNYCDEYLERLLTTLLTHPQGVAEYVRTAPAGTIVTLEFADGTSDLTPDELANRLAGGTDSTLGADVSLINIMFIRELPLETLAERAEGLVDEVGEYFRWNWPFFEASVNGEWTVDKKTVSKTADEESGDVDETAPQSIEALADLTALSEEFLSEFEEALWAKQQAVLEGPPGTSKTYIARQFARYFVRQRQGRPQGRFDVLYMHANWAYEDFFEGLKPVSKDGSLSFESRLGFFLKWVEQLKDYSAKALHVLVLDEINRCDTAAVLGELLQLLEYRGTTVRLLSGRDFVFPRNLFIIGTMNSADRSIGRMDLALSRRFFWLDLHPTIETLDRWLKRPGNNPLGFKASALAQCNALLAEHGIPPEQQIGHAFFMLQRTAEDEDASPDLDKPLNEKRLRQVVRFSVLPYVRELLTMQFGQADNVLLQQIATTLLACIDGKATPESTDGHDADSET